LRLIPVRDKSLLTQPMTPITGEVKAPGGIEGSGSTLIVEHTADNNLVTFRFKHPNVKMAAAEADFEAAGRTFRAGAIIVEGFDRTALEPSLRELGLSGWAVASPPTVKTHDL